MTHEMWFDTGGERVRETLHQALVWCERCHVVTDGAAVAGPEDAFWAAITAEAERRLESVILWHPEATDAASLRPLLGTGRVRRLVEGTGPRSHFVWFESGGELRFLLAPGGLRANTMEGLGLWLYWAGPREALPVGLGAVLEGCRSGSVPLTEGDLAAAAAGPIKYSRPIPSVREVLGRRSVVSFFELEEDDQALALWSALIGEGALDLEQAIRLAAERLRAQGFLEYQILREDGRVYAAIEERLRDARRRTDLFDRPRNGFVRAVQRNLDELTAEQWRDCVLSALEQGVRVDRDHAVRLGFVYAQKVYGVDAQRLRGGGRADHALRSAINSGIRQGYLARDGAAYLVRVAESAPPTLRGALGAESQLAAGTESPVEPEAESPAEAEVARGAEPTPEPSAEPRAPAPEGAVASPPVVELPRADAPSPLDRKLLELDLPTRAANWAERQGIETVRELVAWDPVAFANERNVGRRTVRETRELLEALLGCTWEEANAALRGGAAALAGTTSGEADEEAVDSATEALMAGGAAGWAHLAASLTEEERAIPLLDVRLPARMRNFAHAEGLERVGELFRIPYSALIERANLGRKSLNDTLDAVRDFLSERAAPPVYATFLESWHSQIGALEPIPRLIVTRRAGMHGARETLEEIGAMLGLTRERVRQIERRVLERLRERSRWRRSVEERLGVAFGAGSAVPLHLLAEDPWWAGVERQELLLDYVVSRVFEDELFLFTAPSGKRYLTRFPPSEFEERVESVKHRVAKLEFPVEVAVIDDIVRSEAAALDPVLFVELEQALDPYLHVDPERPEVVLGYGRHREAEVIAFLNAQDAPVPVALVEERCGRGRLPDEVLYFKRGVVGLKRHFPDFDGWMERLVPPALEIMQERPVGRQWLVPEIHDALRERSLVPDWLGHWHLASLLRLSGRVDYLGRLRVATKDSGHDRRLEYADVLEQVLEEAGGPLEFDELLRRARERTDISESSATMLVREAPFVRLDETRVGLVERDIPGGPASVATAVEAVIQRLTETGHGLTPHQATRLVNGLSAAHATWTQPLVTSVLRSEPTLRIDRSRNIGLDVWDDARCPTRAEFIRREVQRAGGTLAIHELNARLEDVYGRAPDRSALGVLAREHGLTIDGDLITRASSVAPKVAAPEPEPAPASGVAPSTDLAAAAATPEPPPSGEILAGAQLEGIPAELREMFDDLVKEPLWSVADLRALVAEHVADLEREHQVNEFVDLPGAHEVAAHCYRLLDRWDTLPLPERHLAHAAVRYFVSWHDVEHDLDIGGLDDDKRIMNAVLAHLGLSEDTDGAGGP